MPPDSLSQDLDRIAQVLVDNWEGVSRRAREIAHDLTLNDNGRSAAKLVASETRELVEDRRAGGPRYRRAPFVEARAQRQDPRTRGTETVVFAAFTAIGEYVEVMEGHQPPRGAYLPSGHPAHVRVFAPAATPYSQLTPGAAARSINTRSWEQIRTDLTMLQVGARKDVYPLPSETLLQGVLAVAAGDEDWLAQTLAHYPQAAAYTGFLTRLVVDIGAAKDPAHAVFQYMALQAGARGALSAEDALTMLGDVASEETRSVHAAWLAERVHAPIPELDRRGQTFPGAALPARITATLKQQIIADLQQSEFDATLAYVQALRSSDEDMARPEVRDLIKRLLKGNPAGVIGTLSNHVQGQLTLDWVYRTDRQGRRI